MKKVQFSKLSTLEKRYFLNNVRKNGNFVIDNKEVFFDNEFIFLVYVCSSCQRVKKVYIRPEDIKNTVDRFSCFHCGGDVFLRYINEEKNLNRLLKEVRTIDYYFMENE